MTHEEFGKLKTGDVVRHGRSGNAYVIITELPNTLVAVRTLIVSNPLEWEKVWPVQLGDCETAPKPEGRL